MHINFVEREDGPEKLQCEAEIVFGEGPLEGLKLVGISIWAGPDGERYVTFPSRAFGAGSDRRFFDYLRPADGNIGAMRRVKDWILAELKAR
jgi:hypothetical protein